MLLFVFNLRDDRDKLQLIKFVWILLLSSCQGQLLLTDGDAPSADAGIKIDTNVEPDAAVQSVLEHASQGVRCVRGYQKEFIVLSTSVVSCEQHAKAIDSFARGVPTKGIMVFEKGESSGPQKYCREDNDCETATLVVNLEGANGSWTGELYGQKRDITFTAQSCAYDELPPEVVDLPASDISITDVSIYQAVEVPIIKEGVWVSNRNAPVIAGRPGMLRVFVRREEDWTQREILVRLTIGGLVKEQRYSPLESSSQDQLSSTINFEFMRGELPTDGNISVELIEIEQCKSDSPGRLFKPTLPAVSTSLDIKALPKPLEIVLVPMRYDADSSGRVPRLEAADVRAYVQEAEEYFPVSEVKITVDSVVPYSDELSPSGAGYNTAMNFCLNYRRDQNAPADVYYYCLFQPGDDFVEYCGENCIAGTAPVAPVDDTYLRAGMGIGFDGRGPVVFVHEMGHMFGRPHAPCGVSADLDPEYPYPDAGMGSIGYSILKKEFYPASSRSDYMGYCKPVWTSDFTYNKLYERFASVMGRQAQREQGQKKRWRNAILEADGTLRWGGSVELDHHPSGEKIGAEIRKDFLSYVPEVFAISLSDTRGAILMIEDLGVSDAILEIAGVGTLRID